MEKRSSAQGGSQQRPVNFPGEDEGATRQCVHGPLGGGNRFTHQFRKSRPNWKTKAFEIMFYYGDDNTGLFKTKNHHDNKKNAKKQLRPNLSRLVILG